MSDSVPDSDVAQKRERLARLEAQEQSATPETARRIAKLKSELGDVRGAVETLTDAIARHPGSLPLIEQCASLRLRLGEMHGVFELLSPLEDDLDPKMAWTLARARVQEGDVQAAADTLSRAFERYPDDPELAARCATYLLNAGDTKGAIAILSSSPESLGPSALAVLAQATAEAGDVAEGDAILVRALDRHPADPLLTRRLANLRLENGRSREAVALLSQSEDTASPEQVMLLAKARLLSGDPAGAMATLEGGIQRLPGDETLLEGLATARWRAGDARGALAALDQSPQPRGGTWFLLRAQALEMLGDFAAFEATVRQGLASFPNDLQLLLQLSKFLASQERLDEARATGAVIEDSVVANPDNLAGLVTNYFIFGDAQGAAEFIDRILTKLELDKSSRRTNKALIDLIPATRLFRSDIGAPIVRRILARLDAHAVLSLGQQVTTAIAYGMVGDHASQRARVVAMMPKLECAKDVIEAISLAAWTNDLATIALLEDRFRNVVKSEQGAAADSPYKSLRVDDVRVFCDRELGAAGFDIGGTDVVILFPGLYNTPGAVQQRLVLGPLARGTDVLRLFDMRRDVLLSGIGPEATGREQSYAALERLVTERGYRRVICVGTSGGGMPAAIYGDAIGAERVVVFSTGTFFPPDDDPLERRARAFLHKVRSTGIEIGSDNREIWLRPGRHPEFHIHYPMRNPQDARHALRMQGLPGVVLHPVDSAQHGFVTTLGDEELTTAIFGTQ